MLALALILRYVLDEKWDFPFGNQWFVLPSTSVSFPFSLWFLCPLSSCTTYLFLPRFCVFYLLLCTLDSVPTLTSIWSGEVAGTLLCGSAYPSRSIVCYFLCIWSCSVPVSLCKRHWFRCWGIAIEWNSAQWMLHWESGDPALARGPFHFAVVVLLCISHKLDYRDLPDMSHFLWDSKIFCGLDHLPSCWTKRINQKSFSFPIFFRSLKAHLEHSVIVFSLAIIFISGLLFFYSTSVKPGKTEKISNECSYPKIRWVQWRSKLNQMLTSWRLNQ